MFVGITLYDTVKRLVMWSQIMFIMAAEVRSLDIGKKIKKKEILIKKIGKKGKMIGNGAEIAS